MARFELRKWANNRLDLLDYILESQQQLQLANFDNDAQATLKILGLQWDATSDNFSFSIKQHEKKISESVCSVESTWVLMSSLIFSQIY